MPRRREIQERDPGLPVNGVHLDWAIGRRGIPVRQLVNRLVKRSEALRRIKRWRMLPDSVTPAAISYWRSGARQTCRRSVLTLLARELGVPLDFLRADRNCRFIPVTMELPGEKPFRIDVSVYGEVGQLSEDESTMTGTFPAGGVAALAEAWTDLAAWRGQLIDGEEEDVEGDDDYEGAALDFFEHMAAALRILLAPLDRGAKLNREAVGRWP